MVVQALNWHAVPLRALALCALTAGCGERPGWEPDDDSAADTGDDDTQVGDEPVISDLTIEPSGDASLCHVLLSWHCEDGDGDLGSESGTIHLYTSFDDTRYVWPWTEGVWPLHTLDVQVEVLVSAPVGEPHVLPATVYDVEVWIVDLSGNESNRLAVPGWASPNSECE